MRIGSSPFYRSNGEGRTMGRCIFEVCNIVGSEQMIRNHGWRKSVFVIHTTAIGCGAQGILRVGPAGCAALGYSIRKSRDKRGTGGQSKSRSNMKDKRTLRSARS